MINFLIGAPGGGKSYEATAFHVLPALEAGRKVITNLPLNREHIEAVFPDAKELLVIVTESKRPGKLPFAVLEDWQDDWRHPKTGAGPLYVVDECHQVMPRSGTEQAIVEHAALHRHTGADWLLMTQDHGKVNKDIKALCQLCYVVRKNHALGAPDSYTRSVYDGLKTSGTTNRVSQTTRNYLPAYFKFYKSHTLTSTAVLEEGARDVTPIFKKFKYFGIAMALLGPLGLGGFYAYNHWFKEPKQAASQEAPTQGANVRPVSSSTAAATSARRSTGAAAVPANPEPSAAPMGAYQLRLLGTVWHETKKVWYFAVESNGVQQYFVTGFDLHKAGYRLKNVADCVVQVEHDKEPAPFYVHCGNAFTAKASLRDGVNAVVPAAVAPVTERAEQLAAPPETYSSVPDGRGKTNLMTTPPYTG